MFRRKEITSLLSYGTSRHRNLGIVSCYMMYLYVAAGGRRMTPELGDERSDSAGYRGRGGRAPRPNRYLTSASIIYY